jgi:hypothetical protein
MSYFANSNGVSPTFTGNVHILGTLIVDGTTTLVSNAATGTITIDITDTEAFLVRKDADAGDVFAINTTASNILLTASDITWASGKAVTAGSYAIQRDVDATNQLHFNVPTGASMEWSVNDVAVMGLTVSGITLATVSNATSLGITSSGLTTAYAETVALSNAAMTTGGFANWTHTIAETTGNKTGNYFNISSDGTRTAAGTTTYNFDEVVISRAFTTNGASANGALSGSILQLNHTATATLGSISDSTNGLELNYSSNGSTGNGINVTYNGRGAAIYATTSNALPPTSGGALLDFGDSSTFTAASANVYALMTLTDGATITDPTGGGEIAYRVGALIDQESLAVVAGVGSLTVIGQWIKPATDADIGTNMPFLVAPTDLTTVVGINNSYMLMMISEATGDDQMGIAITKGATTYTTNTGIIQLENQGAVTGVAGEKMWDVFLQPSTTITEPSSGNFDYATLRIRLDALGAPSLDTGTHTTRALWISGGNSASWNDGSAGELIRIESSSSVAGYKTMYLAHSITGNLDGNGVINAVLESTGVGLSAGSTAFDITATVNGDAQDAVGSVLVGHLSDYTSNGGGATAIAFCVSSDQWTHTLASIDQNVVISALRVAANGNGYTTSISGGSSLESGGTLRNGGDLLLAGGAPANAGVEGSVVINGTQGGAHFRASQDTAPTTTLTSTTLNDGGGSGAAFTVTAGSTDMAGSFTVTAGNGTPTAGIAGQLVFQAGYTAAPKSIVVTSKDADGTNNDIYISAAGTASFTVSFNTALSASEAVEFYYVVIE